MSIPASFLIDPSTLGSRTAPNTSVSSGSQSSRTPSSSSLSKQVVERVLSSIESAASEGGYESWVAPSSCSANNASTTCGGSGLIAPCSGREATYAIVTPKLSLPGGKREQMTPDGVPSLYPSTFSLTIIKDNMRINEISWKGAVAKEEEPQQEGKDSVEREPSSSPSPPIDIKWVKWVGKGMSVLWSDGVSIQCDDVFATTTSDSSDEEDQEQQEEDGGENSNSRKASVINLPNEGVVPLKITNKSLEEEGEGKLAALVVSSKTGCSLIVRDRNPEAPDLSPPVSSHDGGGGTDPNSERKKKKQAQGTKYTWFVSVPPNKAFEGITTVAVCPQQPEEERRLATNQNGVIASFLCFSQSACTLGGLRQDVQSYFLVQRKTLMYGESIIPRCALVPTMPTLTGTRGFDHGVGAITAVLVYYSKEASQEDLTFDEDERTPALNPVVVATSSPETTVDDRLEGGGSAAGTAIAKVDAQLKDAALSSGEATANLRCGFLKVGVNSTLSFQPLETVEPSSSSSGQLDISLFQDKRFVRERTRLHAFDPEAESLWIEVVDEGRLLKCNFSSDSGVVLEGSEKRMGRTMEEDREVALLGLDTNTSLVVESERSVSSYPSARRKDNNSAPASGGTTAAGMTLGLMADEGRAGKWKGSTFFSSTKGVSTSKRLMVSTSLTVRSLSLHKEPRSGTLEKASVPPEEKKNKSQVFQDPTPALGSNSNAPTPAAAPAASPASSSGGQATIEQVQLMLEQQKAQLLEQLKPTNNNRGSAATDGTTTGPGGITFAQQEEKLCWYREEMADLKKQLEKSEKSRQLYKQRCEKKEKELLKAVAQVKPLKTKVAELESVIDRLGVTYPLPKELTESATLRLTALVPKATTSTMEKSKEDGKGKSSASRPRKEGATASAKSKQSAEAEGRPQGPSDV